MAEILMALFLIVLCSIVSLILTAGLSWVLYHWFVLSDQRRKKPPILGRKP